MPAGSITQRISITMRALTGLSSTTVPGNLLGGVLLEPDGLRFAVPATLTVTGAGIGESIRVLTGNQDGTDIDLVDGTAAAGRAEATLWHFSPALASDWEDVDMSEVQSHAKGDWKAIRDAINTALKDPQIRVTPPPSVSLECGDEFTEMLDQVSIDLWMRSVDEPEGELLRATFSSMKLYTIMGWDTAEQQAAADKLLLRQEARVGKLIQQYAGDREKMPAIVSYGISVWWDMTLKGSPTLEGEGPALASKIANYVSSFIDPLINDIKTKHDYKLMRPALLIARQLSLLGGGESKVNEDAITERVLAAMQFKVETTLTFKWPDQVWVLKTTSNTNSALGSLGGKLTLTGEGTGRYVSYSGPVPIIGPGFPVMVALEDFNPCDGTATFAIDRHAADSEEYDFGDGQRDPLRLAKKTWESIFESRLKDGLYHFPVTLQNEQAIIIDQAFDGTSPSGKVTGTLQVKVTHTPK